MKIIKELWRGNLDPVARVGAGDNRVRELEALKQRNRERLSAVLDVDGMETLEKLNDCFDEYLSLMCEQVFYEGFCLGVKTSTESLLGAEEILARDCCL